MNILVWPILLALLSQAPTPTTRGIHDLVFQSPDVGEMRYGLSIPNRYDPKQPRALVLALHPGGARTPNYGRDFMAQIVLPALNGLAPIIIAPDVPARSWTDPVAEKAVLALVQSTMERYAIDRRRVLVIGFSMGGRGTWFMASRHPDLFTAAIAVAASTGDEPIDRLGTIPTYIIHSRNDEVVAFEPAEQNARQLKQMGRQVEFEWLDDPGHFQMGAYIDSIQRAARWVAGRWK